MVSLIIGLQLELVSPADCVFSLFGLSGSFKIKEFRPVGVNKAAKLLNVEQPVYLKENLQIRCLPCWVITKPCCYVNKVIQDCITTASLNGLWLLRQKAFSQKTLICLVCFKENGQFSDFSDGERVIWRCHPDWGYDMKLLWLVRSMFLEVIYRKWRFVCNWLNKGKNVSPQWYNGNNSSKWKLKCPNIDELIWFHGLTNYRISLDLY